VISDRSGRGLRVLTAANLIFVVGLWLIETFVAERHWLTTLITYMPQHWAVLPLLVLLPWALVRRSRRMIGWNLLAVCIFLFGLMGFSVPLRAPTGKSGQAVRIMTWNIHHASGGTENIMAVVEREHPDIVCFQEASDGRWQSTVLPELRKAFKGWHYSGFREVATFSRFPIIEERVHRLMPETGRVVLDTVVDAEGSPVMVWNIHLNVAVGGRSLRSGGLRGVPAYLRHTAAVRRDQMLDLDTILVAAPLVIVGDFNTPPRGCYYRRFASRHRDVFRHAGLGFGYTYPARRPLMRIDYVSADDDIRVRRCFVPKTTASDHRPVVADLVIPRKER